MNFIGHITLNISITIYLIWFLPQVILNFKRKNTAGLSLLMHGILCCGYLSDLIYGFGLGMQWQYRTVTIVGLCSLAIQHYQFGRYGLQNLTEKRTYIFLNIFYFLFLGYVIYTVKFSSYHHNTYDLAGMLANTCWLCYMLPQIVKNYINQSTKGLSHYFVFIAIFLNCCDFTSACALGWDYPSKIGPAVALLGNLILLLQVFYYDAHDKKFWRLVARS